MGTSNRNDLIGALIVIMGLFGNGLHAQPNVKVKGYVNAPEELRTPVNITVKVPDGEIIWEKTKRHPGMKFKVPAGTVYAITFKQAGSLTKSVELDTRHAVRAYTKNQTRPVNFEVIMEAADENEIRYAGPVGRIGFSAMNGRMDVGYDYSLERVDEERRNENDAAQK